MKTWLIIDKTDLSIANMYKSDIKKDTTEDFIPCFLEPRCVHKELPEGMDNNSVRIEFINNDYVIVLDEDKLVARRARLFNKLRQQRNEKLQACDYTQMPDSPLSEELKEAWANYRQALRDLPANTENPSNPIWPTKPE
jgi:hypothetical protein